MDSSKGSKSGIRFSVSELSRVRRQYCVCRYYIVVDVVVQLVAERRSVSTFCLRLVSGELSESRSGLGSPALRPASQALEGRRFFR